MSSTFVGRNYPVLGALISGVIVLIIGAIFASALKWIVWIGLPLIILALMIASFVKSKFLGIVVLIVLGGLGIKWGAPIIGFIGTSIELAFLILAAAAAIAAFVGLLNFKHRDSSRPSPARG